MRFYKKLPKGSQIAPNGTIFFKISWGKPPRTLQWDGTPVRWCLLLYFFHLILILLGKTLYLLAHLSRRLIGELIVYQWSGVRRPSTFSSIFFSKTAWLIKAKFYVEPPWLGGTKFCSRHLGHMTTPIYGKNPSKIFSGTGRQISMKLGM